MTLWKCQSGGASSSRFLLRQDTQSEEDPLDDEGHSQSNQGEEEGEGAEAEAEERRSPPPLLVWKNHKDSFDLGTNKIGRNCEEKKTNLCPKFVPEYRIRGKPWWTTF